MVISGNEDELTAYSSLANATTPFTFVYRCKITKCISNPIELRYALRVSSNITS